MAQPPSYDDEVQQRLLEEQTRSLAQVDPQLWADPAGAVQARQAAVQPPVVVPPPEVPVAPAAFQGMPVTALEWLKNPGAVGPRPPEVRAAPSEAPGTAAPGTAAPGTAGEPPDVAQGMLAKLYADATAQRQAGRQAALNNVLLGNVVNTTNAFAQNFGKRPGDKSRVNPQLLEGAMLPDQWSKGDSDRKMQLVLKALSEKKAGAALNPEAELEVWLAAQGANVTPEQADLYRRMVRSGARVDQLMKSVDSANRRNLGDARNDLVAQRIQQAGEQFQRKMQERDEDQEYRKAKNLQDLEKLGGENLRRYGEMVDKDFGDAPQSFKELAEAAADLGAEGNDFAQLFRQLAAKKLNGADSRLNINNPKQLRLYNAMQAVANSIMRSRSGMAVTDQEAKRIQQELGTGDFAAVGASLAAMDRARKKMGERLLSLRSAYSGLVPPQVWASVPHLTTDNSPIFADIGKGPDGQAPQMLRGIQTQVPGNVPAAEPQFSGPGINGAPPVRIRAEVTDPTDEQTAVDAIRAAEQRWGPKAKVTYKNGETHVELGGKRFIDVNGELFAE